MFFFVRFQRKEEVEEKENEEQEKREEEAKEKEEKGVEKQSDERGFTHFAASCV